MSYFSFLKQFNIIRRPVSTISQKKQEIAQINQVNNVSQNNDFSVLIADDNKNTLQQIEYQLKQSENPVALADDGIIAHTWLLLNRYDLIFLNPNLECNNQGSLISNIKQENSLNTNTPIIAITNSIEKQQRKKLITIGFDDCLEIPISKDQLSEILNLWLPNSIGLYQNDNISKTNYVDAMLRTTQGDKKIASTFFNKLFIELPKQIQSIEKALALGKFKAAKDTVHKLHGSILYFGFNDIQKTVQSLEISLEQEYLEAIEPNFTDLKDKISDLINLKQTILNQLAL